MSTHGERRKTEILQAGLRLWPDVSARNIGRHIGMTHTAILYHFGSAAALRDAVAVHAVRCADARVIPALLVERHAAVAGMSIADRAAYLRAV